MATKKHLIIGSGSAALSALEAIRRASPEDEIKLVSMDDCSPYSPAALPYLLSGRITEADLWLKDEGFFKNLKSILVKGKEVTGVMPEKRQVVYRDGSSENYDTLLIASGAEPVQPSIKGFNDVEVHNFRTLADCRALMRKLNGKKNVVILGGGLVGTKIAVALLEKEHQVSIIEKERSILCPYFNDEAEGYIRDIFSDNGARLLTGKEVVELSSKDGGVGLSLSDGSSLEADILINATGVKSRMFFLEGTGIRTNIGILVDSRMSAGTDHVFAAGDVAETPDFFTGRPKTSAIIPSAAIQGRVAGANMAGLEAEYEGGIPMTAFNFMGNQAFSIGLINPFNSTGQVLKQKDDKKRKFKKLVFDGDRLVGGMFLNEKVDPGIILYLIREKIDLASHKAALFERTEPLSDPWLTSLRVSSLS